MKLYLLTRKDNDYIGYGEYIGAVIAATSPPEAIKIMYDLDGDEDLNWECMLIAEVAEPKIQKGIVLDSYNDE